MELCHFMTAAFYLYFNFILEIAFVTFHCFKNLFFTAIVFFHSLSRPIFKVHVSTRIWDQLFSLWGNSQTQETWSDLKINSIVIYFPCNSSAFWFAGLYGLEILLMTHKIKQHTVYSDQTKGERTLLPRQIIFLWKRIMLSWFPQASCF